jgi:tRNA(adenine34) deaminase
MEAEERYMCAALERAREAGAAGEVPVGAVIVKDGIVIGSGANASITAGDPTAHAEIQAIRSAARAVANYRLVGSTLYTTLEPCAMCAGAIVHARIDRVVIAARDPKAGAAGSVLDVIPNARLNHRPVVEFGLLEDDSAQMLKAFFRERREEA